MGLGTWLARKGNVGGTARAVAIGWKTIMQNNPGSNDEQIAETYVGIRYGATGEPHLAKQVLEDIKDEDSTINPLNLAWSILSVENSGEISALIEHYVAWRKIMREEIEKLGVKPE